MLPRALSLTLLLAPVAAQREPPVPPTAGARDPYTRAEPELMTAAGVLAYGPFVWAGTVRTDDVDRVLGEHRIRWLETAHFRIGSTLATADPPADAGARRLLNAELAGMRKRHGKYPDRASKLDPWLRVHLCAQRLEMLYAELAQLVGHDEQSGTHLGQQGKFPVLLLQKQSDAARYFDRFCGVKSQMSQRCDYGGTQRGFVLVAEGEEPYDEATVHAHLRFFAVQMLCALVRAAGAVGRDDGGAEGRRERRPGDAERLGAEAPQARRARTAADPVPRARDQDGLRLLGARAGVVARRPPDTARPREVRRVPRRPAARQPRAPAPAARGGLRRRAGSLRRAVARVAAQGPLTARGPFSPR
jgi:hypothetical protein